MRYVVAILALVMLGAGLQPASAQDGRRARFGVQSGEMQSLDRILSGIRQQYPGRLSDVDGPDDGRYHIKWLTPDGRVLMFDTDARTGRVLGVEGNVGPRARVPGFPGGPFPHEGFGDPRTAPPPGFAGPRPGGPLSGRYFQDRRGRGDGRDNGGRRFRDR
jgi:hypothetical protein